MRWGILGSGSIAATFAGELAAHDAGRLALVGSRSPDRARDLAWTAGRTATYEEVVEAPDVDAVYVALPHPMHAEWTVRAARAGKHVLCEKPLAMNRAEAERVAREADRAGVVVLEAFMYRCHPQTRRLAELVRDGAVGEVRLVRASFG